MQVIHEILVPAADLATASQRVRRFFDQYQLVRYDAAQVRAEASWPASRPELWQAVDRGEAANRQAVANLLRDLGALGLAGLPDLANLEQGYPSKLLHTLAHFLDGFFGVDSAFYNLAEDSHWLSASLRQRIAAEPDGYWLLTVAATFCGVSADRTGLLRGPAAAQTTGCP
ncbi:MAG: hypothetical protein AB1634_03520 [Thermodesulfobacteriota bacterium]